METLFERLSGADLFLLNASDQSVPSLVATTLAAGVAVEGALGKPRLGQHAFVFALVSRSGAIFLPS